jgi:hypothetical protein
LDRIFKAAIFAQSWRVDQRIEGWLRSNRGDPRWTSPLVTTLERISKKSKRSGLRHATVKNAHILHVCSAFRPLQALTWTLILFLRYALKDLAPAATSYTAYPTLRP